MHIQNFDPYDFSRTEIGGVPVYYKNLPWAPCIHVRVVFNTGAFNDPAGKEGLSHFLEHMIFDGSPLLPNKKAIREWSKNNALNTWNAWTSHNVTTYWLKCVPESYTTVLTGMKDMIFSPLLKTEDIEHERKVIIQEAWGRFKNEKFLAYVREYDDIVFHGHAHEKIESPLGWPETISSITHEDVASWHKDNYGKGNFFIVLSGAITPEHVERLKDFVSSIPHVSPVQVSTGIIGKPKQNILTKTADEIGEVKEQVEISILRAKDKIPESKSEIASMTRSLMYDLLHERLRIEHSLCYSVGMNAWLEKEYSQIWMSVKTEEKNIDLVQKEFWNVINEIQKNKHTERFETIKKLAIEQVRSVERFSGDIADSAVRDIPRYGHIVALEDDLKEMNKVTYKDVADFIKEIFDPEYTLTEIILPSKK